MGFVIIALGLIFAPLLLDLYRENERSKKIIVMSIKGFVIVYLLCFIGYVFTPTKKEMLAIYGFGTTIDYIKGNNKVKELPDKVVDALTQYLDTIAEEDEKKEEK